MPRLGVGEVDEVDAKKAQVDEPESRHPGPGPPAPPGLQAQAARRANHIDTLPATTLMRIVSHMGIVDIGKAMLTSRRFRACSDKVMRHVMATHFEGDARAVQLARNNALNDIIKLSP